MAFCKTVERIPGIFKSIFVAGLLYSFSAHAAEPVSYNIFTTNETVNSQPAHSNITEYNCSDRIYLVVEAIGLTEGLHKLVVKWINPVNEQQELTNFTFNANPSYTRIWAWLQLHGPTGAVLGQMFDPSFGMEDFIGGWHTEVYIDNKKIFDLPFNVIC